MSQHLCPYERKKEIEPSGQVCIVEKVYCFLLATYVLVLLQRDKLMRFKTLTRAIELWPLDY